MSKEARLCLAADHEAIKDPRWWHAGYRAVPRGKWPCRRKTRVASSIPTGKTRYGTKPGRIHQWFFSRSAGAIRRRCCCCAICCNIKCLWRARRARSYWHSRLFPAYQTVPALPSAWAKPSIEVSIDLPTSVFVETDVHRSRTSSFLFEARWRATARLAGPMSCWGTCLSGLQSGATPGCSLARVRGAQQ